MEINTSDAQGPRGFRKQSLFLHTRMVLTGEIHNLHNRLLFSIIRQFWALLILISVPFALRAQCGLEYLQYQDSVCAGTNLTLINDSAFTGQIGFDICHEQITQFDSVITHPGLAAAIPNATYSVSVVQDLNGDWYGFAKAPNLATLVRFDFGASLTNTPSVTTLTTTSRYNLATTTRGGIRVVYSNGLWYGMTSFVTSRLAVLAFGGGLGGNTVTITAHFNATALPSPADIEIVNGNIVVAVLNSNGTVGMLNFGTTPTSPPVLATAAAVINPLDMSAGRAIEVVKTCGNYHIFASGITRQKLIRLQYGPSLFNTNPTYEVDATGVFYPSQMRSSTLGGEVQIWVKNRAQAFTKYTYSAGLDSLTSTQNFYNSAYNLSGDGFDLAYSNGDYVAVSITLDEILGVTTFENACSESSTIIWNDTASVNYSGQGALWNSMVYKDNFQQLTFVPFKTWIRQSPQINWSYSGVCIGDTTLFTDLSVGVEGIASWSWQFGDSSTSSIASPSHMYQDTGIYAVQFEITDSNGCSNSSTQSIQIEALPTAALSHNLLCQGKSIAFADSSSFIGSAQLGASRWIFDANDTLFGNALTYPFPVTG